MNYTNKYNNKMGDVDISNKLGNYYKTYIWLSNRKWWGSIFFWAVGFICNNAYIIYICIHNIQGTRSKHILYHHDFRKSISSE